MTDYTELKRLAEGAVNAGDHWGRRDQFTRQLEKLVTPKSVLALLAEIDRLEGCDKAYQQAWEKARGLQSEMDKVAAKREQLQAELSGLRTGFDAQNEVIAGLKAENEALRDGANFRAIQSLRQDCEELRKALHELANHPKLTASQAEILRAAMSKGERP